MTTKPDLDFDPDTQGTAKSDMAEEFPHVVVACETRCGDCYHWRTGDNRFRRVRHGVPNWGECHKCAPPATFVYGSPAEAPVAQWPRTPRHESCGEFQRLEPAAVKAAPGGARES